MTKRQLKHFDIFEAKKAYKEGRNITELLRSQKNSESNTSEIIETAYDLQAGSYIEHITSVRLNRVNLLCKPILAWPSGQFYLVPI